MAEEATPAFNLPAKPGAAPVHNYALPLKDEAADGVDFARRLLKWTLARQVQPGQVDGLRGSGMVEFDGKTHAVIMCTDGVLADVRAAFPEMAEPVKLTWAMQSARSLSPKP
jgi:hypothetical protein